MTAPLVSTTDRPYQLLPPLTVEQRDLLWQSIKANGVLEPVVFDEDGEILDGHHRVEIAEELGIDYPRRVIDDLDGPSKYMYALTVNVARRQLDQSARGSLVAQMRVRGMSIRRIAEALGVSRGTVANDLAQLSNSGQLEQPERITGADGKDRPATRPTPQPTPVTPGPVDADGAPPADPGTTPDPRDRTHGAEFESYDAAEPETCLGTDMDCGRPLPCPDHPAAGPGSTSPEPGPPASKPAEDPVLAAALAADSTRRAAIRNLTSVLTYLNPVAIAPAELAEREYLPVLDAFSQEELDRAAETMATIAAMKRGAR